MEHGEKHDFDIAADHHISRGLGLVLLLSAAYLLTGLFVALDSTSASALFGPADFLLFFGKMLVWPLLLLG